MRRSTNSNGNARRAAQLDRVLATREREIGSSPQGGPALLLPEGVGAPVPSPTPPPGRHLPTSSMLGIPGTPIISGFLEDLGEYNGELAGRNALPIYEKMRRGDAQVRATLAACKLPVLSAKWDVVPHDVSRQPSVASSQAQRATDQGQPTASNGEGHTTQAKANEIAEFVRENLFGGLEFRTSTGGWATQNWDDVVRNALLMLDFGCAVHEDVWTVDGNRIRLRKLAARLPITFYRWHTEADGETLLGLEQYGYRRGQYLNALVPADKCCVFTYQQEGANFWGISLQRPMYPHWYVKSNLYRIDAIACERNSLGVPVFKLAPGFSAEDRQAAYNFVTQLAAHEATGMVEPPGDASTGFRIVGYEGRVRDLAPSIEHHNVMISRAALALFMDLGQAEHGSRALGKEHGDFFLLALQNLADQIATGITNSTVRRLVSYNFGDDAPVPRLVAANVQARGLEDIVEALTRFAQAGLVVSEENLRSFIREELALPPESPSAVGNRPSSVAGGQLDVGAVEGNKE
ncbi:MAG TPA: hypothetical protein VGZ29_13690 [Terriglobia bacterium]|nr:hypothetical protein [Terriglobia bacterium]